MIPLQAELKDLLQLAYSAERAASFAYQGHAGAVKEPEDKKRIKEIEDDEWIHRADVLKIMQEYEIPISTWYEVKYFIIGKIICYSCYVIGWFMPMYFAGRLESGNVNEYFIMKDYFNQLNITKHDAILAEMGMKEKEHEVYFLSKIKTHKWLPFFEKVFSWGNNKSLNSIK
ncbi:MAG TPA: hypothetical protein PKI86_01945 [Chitinophagales bacterium]|jgi:rubrerythrin|nr:hypothetical protein [Chitinophagales bacterium]